jgi:hypothetical protein
MRSLRVMERDHGWIHTLLEEAENERMVGITQSPCHLCAHITLLSVLQVTCLLERCSEH